MKAPAFQFYPDDFVGGVADMTQAEVGAYILLLCAQWGRGSVPVDPERAALIAKGPVSEHVMSKFPKGKNKRLEKVRENLELYRSSQSVNGAKGASKRWHGGAMATPSREHGDTIVSPMAKNSSPTPTPSPTLILTPNPTSADLAPPAATRARNVLCDELARACGSDPFEMTAPAMRACAVALATIRKVCPNLEPAEIARRVAAYRRKFSGAALTPSALANHWGALGSAAPSSGRRSQAEIDAEQEALAAHFKRP